MDVTNRVIIVAGAFVWVFFILVVVLLAWGAPENSIDALKDFVEYLDDHTDNLSRIILTLGGVILMLVAVVLIIAEVTPPATAAVKVQQVKAGSAVISTQEIEHRVQQEVASVPHVSEAAVKVLGRGRGVELELDLHVDPQANLSETAEETCRRARELAEGKMGIALLQPPRAHLRYKEIQLAPAAEAPSTEAGVETPGEAAEPSAEMTHEAEAQETEEDPPATG
ncbi:MAG: alkaline shock response membrane anchor protein AmaP [Dehalococcoidia bacterium]